MSYPTKPTRHYEWSNYTPRSKYTVTYKYDPRGPYGTQFAVLTPSTEKYLYNKGTQIDYDEMRQTIENTTEIFSKGVKLRRIRNLLIAGGSGIILLIGIAMLLAGVFIGSIIGELLLYIGIGISVLGCCIFAIVTSIVGIFESRNSSLKKVKKFLKVESKKKYTDILDFQVESFRDTYQDYRTRKVPVGTPGPNQKQQYRQERYVATIPFMVYYIHITNKFPPNPQQEQEPDFFKNIPQMSRVNNPVVPNVNTTNINVRSNQILPVNVPVNNMNMNQMPQVQPMPVINQMQMNQQVPVQTLPMLNQQMPMNNMGNQNMNNQNLMNVGNNQQVMYNQQIPMNTNNGMGM